MGEVSLKGLSQQLRMIDMDICSEAVPYDEALKWTPIDVMVARLVAKVSAYEKEMR